MNDNPNGFVINTESRAASRLAFLHQSKCPHIAGLAVGHRSDAFTRYEYIKVCSNDEIELLVWIFENRPNAKGFSNLCKTCVPEPVITQYEAESPVAIDIEAPPPNEPCAYKNVSNTEGYNACEKDQGPL